MSDSTEYVPLVLQPAGTAAAQKRVRTHWQRYVVRPNPPDDPAYLLLWAVLTRIRADNYVRPYYSFPMGQVFPTLKGDERIACIRYAIRQLMAVVFCFDYPDGDGFFPLQLLRSSGPHPPGHTARRIHLAFNPHLTQYLLNVARLDNLPPPALAW